MNRLADAGRSLANVVVKQVGRVAGRIQETSLQAADVLESDDAYLVVFDAPGVAASDVQVRFRRGAVEVRIDRFREHHEGFEMRFPGRGLSLDGRARLPGDATVDPEGATATLRDNGTLEVRIPKAAGEGGGETVVVEEAATTESGEARG